MSKAIRAALSDPKATGQAPYAEFALTLYAFMSRLRAELAERQATEVLFCSREGQFLTRVFERYQEGHGELERIAAHYFLVSRRSTLLPGLGTIDEEEFAGLRSSFPKLTNAGFLHSLSLLDHIEQTHLDLEAPLDLAAIRTDPAVRHVYELRRKEQSSLLTGYVSDLTGSEDGTLHIVDVGWRGSTQDHLTAAFSDTRAVRGYYMGLVAERPIAHLDAKSALVFGPSSDSYRHYRVLKHFKMIWEYVLGADHGSVAHYEPDSDGKSQPVLDPVDVELADFGEVVGPMQEGIFETFDRLCNVDGFDSLSQTTLQDLVARHHSRMLFFPTSTELSIAWHRGHYANFGEPWVKETPQRIEVTAAQRLRNLGGLARHPGRVLRGFPPLTLYKLGLEPLIPIVGWYRQLREFPPKPLAKLSRLRGARRQR